MRDGGADEAVVARFGHGEPAGVDTPIRLYSGPVVYLTGLISGPWDARRMPRKWCRTCSSQCRQMAPEEEARAVPLTAID